MTFAQRDVQFSITLASDPNTNQPNTFTESGSNSVTLQGSRSTTRISNSGSPGGSTASIDVYGVTLSIINQLCTLGMVVTLVPRNTLIVQAGDLGGNLSTVFTGTIVAAYGDFNASPEVPFHFECNSITASNVISAKPSSYQGSADAADILSSLAGQMGVGFENNGVSAKLSNPYYAGSAWSQVQQVAFDANISAELINGVLCIWPFPGSRSGDTPVISPSTGMKGYPSYTQQGIVVQTEYNPAIKFGGQVQVQDSILTPANGTWNVYKLDHELDCQVPSGGQWFSTVYCYNPNHPQPLPPA